MDKKSIDIDVATFKFLYTKYKDFRIPLIVIVVCTLLLVGFLVPQFQKLLDVSRKAEESEKNVQILKKNFDVLSSINESSLDSRLGILSIALPNNKDFIGIINAISYASSIAGVEIGDFQLNVGDLSEESASSSKSSTTPLSIFVDADIDGVNRFISVLATTLPLSEVTAINTGDFSSSINVVFHHRAFPPTERQGIYPIVTLENDELALISELANFNYVASEELGSIFEVGTSSGNLSEDF